MKKLTVLPENWKPEIDYRKAKFFITRSGLFAAAGEGQKGSPSESWAFYDIVNCEPVKMTPEPRPADSIKLSECEPHHFIECLDGEARTCYATYISSPDAFRTEEWVVRNMRGSIEAHGDLVRMMHNFGSIEIYDMTEEQDKS
jgi:hypothetical protein